MTANPSRPRNITESRDYLAYQIKANQIPLSGRQKEEVRLYLTRNPSVAPVLNPFTRVSPEERKRVIRKALRQCVSDGVVAQAADPGEQHNYRNYDDEQLLNTLYAQVVGLDVLETLLQDEDVSSITVINESTILYEKNGQTYIHPSGFENRARMIEVIKNLAIRGGQQLTPAAPTADLAFPPPQVVRIHETLPWKPRRRRRLEVQFRLYGREKVYPARYRQYVGRRRGLSGYPGRGRPGKSPLFHFRQTVRGDHQNSEYLQSRQPLRAVEVL